MVVCESPQIASNATGALQVDLAFGEARYASPRQFFVYGKKHLLFLISQSCGRTNLVPLDSDCHTNPRCEQQTRSYNSLFLTM